MDEIICTCDGTLDGIFSAIYRAWHLGTSRTHIDIAGGDMVLFTTYEHVETNLEHSRKVSDMILEKMGMEVYEAVSMTAMSTLSTRAEDIYRTLVLGVRLGNKVLENMANPHICNVVKMRKKVWYEAHRYLGFLRFEEVGRVLIAKFSPDSDCLSLVAEHFSDRLLVENFAIIDVKRKKVALHKAKGHFIVTDISDEDIYSLESNTDEYKDLWKAFFDTIMIKERENRKLQTQMMPLKYRTFMDETKG